MKIRVEKMGFKAALILVGLLVIVMDVKKDVAEGQILTKDKTSPYCTGTTLKTCQSVGACCVWCTNATTMFTNVNTTDPGTCYSAAGFTNDVCNGPQAQSSCLVQTFVNSACTCQIGPASSDAHSFAKPSYFTVLILTIISFLFISSKR